ncbi:MAG: hypothetical protein WA139_05940 [Candidatus Aenigmatarchaeota archaeon]
MSIKPESIIEAFQKSVKFPCGVRTLDFYSELGISENDIRETLGNGNVPVSYGNRKYVIGLTKDGSKEYVTIIPEIPAGLILNARKLAAGLKKQGRL